MTVIGQCVECSHDEEFTRKNGKSSNVQNAHLNQPVSIKLRTQSLVLKDGIKLTNDRYFANAKGGWLMRGESEIHYFPSYPD